MRALLSEADSSTLHDLLTELQVSPGLRPRELARAVGCSVRTVTKLLQVGARKGLMRTQSGGWFCADNPDAGEVIPW